MPAQVRTTVHLDADVYQAARSLAAAKGQGLGNVLSALARKGLHAPSEQRRARRGFPIFDVPADAKRLTTEMVRSALEDE
jgi:hypothetical protein